MPLWENPNYVSPAKYRQQVRVSAKDKYESKLQQKVLREANRPTESYRLNPLDDLFKENVAEFVEGGEDGGGGGKVLGKGKKGKEKQKRVKT